MTNTPGWLKFQGTDMFLPETRQAEFSNLQPGVLQPVLCYIRLANQAGELTTPMRESPMP